MDTIFALASAPGKAGVAVVRISGPDALAVGTAMAGALPPARGSALRTLRAANNDVLDQALLRPGRFDRRVYLTLPDRKDREQILAIHAGEKALAEDVDSSVVESFTT